MVLTERLAVVVDEAVEATVGTAVDAVEAVEAMEAMEAVDEAVEAVEAMEAVETAVDAVDEASDDDELIVESVEDEDEDASDPGEGSDVEGDADVDSDVERDADVDSDVDVDVVDAEEVAPKDVNVTASAQAMLLDVYETLNSDIEEDGDGSEPDDYDTDDSAYDPEDHWRFSYDDADSDGSEMDEMDDATSVPVADLPQTRFQAASVDRLGLRQMSQSGWEHGTYGRIHVFYSCLANPSIVV